MSFRNRLTLFFVLIVILPMVSVTFVLFRLISDNENGKADARIAARQQTAINLFYEARDKADRTAVRIGGDVRLATALHAGDRAAARARAQALLGATGAKRIVLAGGASATFDVGRRDAVFPASRDLVAAGNRRFGRLQVSAETAPDYVARTKRIADLETIVRRGGAVLGSSIRGYGVQPLPARQGKVEIAGRTYRVSSFDAPGFLGTRARVSVLESTAGTSSEVRRSRLLAAAILIGFFTLAFTFAVIVSRALQRQLEGLLEGAQRLGSGDFSTRVEVQGRDEFAALGQEFNRMSSQLETQLEELREQRVRLENAMRRIGEAFASNLDRDALLEIVVRASVDGVGADGGRAQVHDRDEHELREVASTGDLKQLDAVLTAAETQTLASDAPYDAEAGGTFALAHPLRRTDSGEGGAGTVSVARAGKEFTSGERELFHYLAAQAGVSIENVGLHETVERQAVTDELTGLANRRRFQEALASEVERARRFGQELALMMLDIDDFKAVNDAHGHQQGDIVLRAVGHIVRESSREIDVPSRYGGEELAVVLPGTDLDGAFQLAERIREAIEALRFTRPGADAPLTVTASFGVAAIPESAGDTPGLVAAADAALYEAKRNGKNCTVRA